MWSCFAEVPANLFYRLRKTNYLSGSHITRLRLELVTARMKSVLTPTCVVTHLAVPVQNEGKDVSLIMHHPMKMYEAVEL
jgi:hypothetical protein